MLCFVLFGWFCVVSFRIVLCCVVLFVFICVFVWFVCLFVCDQVGLKLVAAKDRLQKLMKEADSKRSQAQQIIDLITAMDIEIASYGTGIDEAYENKHSALADLVADRVDYINIYVYVHLQNHIQDTHS